VTIPTILTRAEAASLERAQARVTPEQAVALALAQSAADGWYWLQYVQTRDEADPEQPVKKFPCHLDYARELWKILERDQQIVIAKSRQMLISWIVASFCVWWARFKPHQSVYFQTQGWPDAVAMTAMPSGGYQGRCQFIEENLPHWMRLNYKASEGRIQYPNGSIIQALAGGANQIRGKTPSVYVGDEFAFMEEQDKVWTAVAPLVQKGSKAILISTPNGAGNEFATLWHGRSVRGDPHNDGVR